MTLLTILRYPDPRLHKVAAKVDRVDDKIRQLIKDMAATMYAAPGVGLAATQVDVHKRVIIIDTSETRDQLNVFVNPEIVAASGEADCEEGCLSVPGVYEKVRRAERIIVQTLGGDCHSPIGALAEIAGENMTLRVAIGSRGGTPPIIRASAQCPCDHPDGAVGPVLKSLSEQGVQAMLAQGR